MSDNEEARVSPSPASATAPASLVQGVEYYRDADPTERVPGLMHVELGGYHVGDVEFVAAFDVDADKVGLDLGKAIFAEHQQHDQVRRRPRARRDRAAGPDLRRLRQVLPRGRRGVARPSRSTSPRRCATRSADVLVSYLPVGSEEAQKHYAQACLDAGVGFVNAIPVFIASDPEWAQKFTDAGVPIVGDDIKSQVGATITHRLLARLFEDRGLAIDHTYQLNFGGNMDFKNMLERERLKSKKISKTQSVTSQIDQGITDRRRAHRPVRPRAVARRPQVGATSASRAATSATCRSTSSSSSRCGTRRTRPA